jgi:carboxymethylenebutenolidase
MVMTAWNQLKTDADEGMVVETVTVKGHNGDSLRAYMARPAGNGPFPGIVLVHHVPGWDEFYRETTRRFAQHGYAAICPNLFSRFGEGSPDDVAAKARAAGVPDAGVVGDLKGTRDWLVSQPYSTGKVGVIGSCSGGRHAFLTACSTDGFDAVVECWGGRVVMPPDALNPNTPVSPIDLTKDLKAPILGLFGNEDQNPSPEQVDLHEAELKKHGKDYEFHRYDGAGHGFFYYDRPAYRQEQAMDAWGKIFDFFGRHLK